MAEGSADQQLRKSTDYYVGRQETLKRYSTLRSQNVPQKALGKQGLLQLKEGMFFKKFPLKFFRSAWAVVDSTNLLIFKDENAPMPRLTVPLTQSYVTFAESEKSERLKTLEMRLSSGNEVVIKCPSEEDAKEWMSTIRSNTKILDVALMTGMKAPNPLEGFSGEVLKIGWVRERPAGSSSWRWRYLAMTDCCLYISDKALSSPSQFIQAKSILLFESKTRELAPNELDFNTTDERKFTFLIVTSKDSLFMSTETRNEMINWVNALKSTCHNSVKFMESISIEGTVDDQDVSLNIRRSVGFVLQTIKDQSELWRYPFSQFKQVKATKTSLLLDFGKFSDHILEISMPDPHRATIIIYNMMDMITGGKTRRDSIPGNKAAASASDQPPNFSSIAEEKQNGAGVE